MNYQFIKKSSNAKIGKMPATNSHRGTCPDACPLKGGACYAEAGFHTKLNWNKLDSGERGGSFASICGSVDALPLDTIWRHNVSGDLIGSDDVIDEEALAQLVQANKGKRGFTYTHYPMTPHNRDVVRMANDGGFTVNVSTNSVAEAIVEYTTSNLPVVTIVPRGMFEEHKRTFVKDGVRFMQCPAEYLDTNCKECGLCQQGKRSGVVAFTAHGSKAKQADIIASA